GAAPAPPAGPPPRTAPRRSTPAPPPPESLRVPRDAHARESAGPTSRRSRRSPCHLRPGGARPRPAPRKRASRRPPGTPVPVSSLPRGAPLAPGRRAPPSGSRQGNRLEIVILAGGHARRQEAPGAGPAALRQVRHAVDVVRLPRHPSDVRRPRGVVGVSHPVHQDRHVAPDEPTEPLSRDGA